ncbi:MAG: SPOR domain-containing protein [Sedimenticola sp.]|nr:SPOR domain-containing protein [Sedimenticola sp.]
MKWLVSLLLLANIVLLGWGLQQNTADQSVRPAIHPGVGNLKLLSELSENGNPSDMLPEQSLEGGAVSADNTAIAEVPDTATGSDQDARADSPQVEAQEPAVADGAVLNSDAIVVDNVADMSAVSGKEPSSLPKETELPKQPITLACGAFGPFERGAEARALAESLMSQGMDASHRRESMEKPIGYWVVIPPLENQQAAIDKVSQLRQSGITDLRRFVKGEQRYGISLGVFSSKNNAEARRKEVASKGHSARVVPRLISVPTYWVDYRAEKEQVVKVVENLAQRNESIKNQEYPCSRVVTSGGIF